MKLDNVEIPLENKFGSLKDTGLLSHKSVFNKIKFKTLVLLISKSSFIIPFRVQNHFNKIYFILKNSILDLIRN